MPGFALGQRLKDKLGMRASSTAELVFENVRVPSRNIVGDPGRAVVAMMRNLNWASHACRHQFGNCSALC